MFYNIHARSSFTSVKCTLSATDSDGGFADDDVSYCPGREKYAEYGPAVVPGVGDVDDSGVVCSVPGSTTMINTCALFLTNIAIFERCD